MREINFPVVQSIAVDGYLLYPGSSQDPGLHHEFLPGVNVVVGINGIGKTTLLLMLLRMLSGAKDLRVQDEIGGSQRALGGVDTSILGNRVPDRAGEATATVRFQLGKVALEITRNLSNLQLTDLTVDPPEFDLPNFTELEERYKYVVMGAAKLDDFYDFVLLLRYLVFYMEDRRSLVWDKWAQTEVLRILFVPDALQSQYKKAINTALSADSTARNTQTILTRQKNALIAALRTAQLNSPGDLGLLRVKVQELSVRAEALADELARLDEERRERRKDAEQRRHDAERVSQLERAERERYLAQFFPQLTDYGAFVLAGIQSMRGCLVCGTTDPKHLEKISNRLTGALSCPLCESEPKQQELLTQPINGENHADQLDKLDAERRELLRSAALAEAEANRLQTEFLQVQLKKDRLENELKADRQQLSFREAAAAGTRPEELSKLDERVRVLQETVADALSEKEVALQTLKAIVDKLSEDITQFRQDLVDQFGKFITSFLAERCVLDYRSVPRRIGQGGGLAIDFPEFHVLMTSGVFRQSGTARDVAGSVSESQKEFIELGFRMALMALASKDRQCAMIVETPEASLDAVFMPKAGATFHKFSEMSDPQHILIATSNLNGSLMIPALLGLVDPHGKRIEPTSGWESSVAPRVLNLLEVAAKSQALREYDDDYQRSLAEALGMEVDTQ
jgi:hypothetical protein